MGAEGTATAVFGKALLGPRGAVDHSGLDPHETEEIRMRESETVATTSEGQMGGSRGTISEALPSVLATTSRERSPLHVYLSRLSEGSRPTMSEALSTVARIASAGRLEPQQLPWHELRYQPTCAGYPNGPHRFTLGAHGEAS